ncbi:hypothetical protein B5G20_04980 [Collinsella sp. An7]|uniref:VG15 protein n=1 Tax=Collinsella sp. An7 TaxID=1965651 RepID=UPI000B3AE1FE|nr:hypothetical protein [Collinsella sp. An7]OUN47322.1 hypothetical protein B5G20_04980 [Collinsella sp. An7]
MAVTIPRAAVDFLTEEINGISADAQFRVLEALQGINWTPENIAECRDLVLQILATVMPTYTTMAAQASADLYDAARELVLGERLGAVAISGYDPRKTERAVRGFVRFVLDGRVETFNDQVLQRIDYEMKRSAGESMFANGRRDPRKPKFARVPTGDETCDFCLMLASRGFVYSSEATAGAVKLDHYHSGCNCRVVCQWGDGGVEGYDTKAINDRWQDAVDALAAERAERRGTTADEERDKIFRGYANSAKHAKKVARMRTGKPTA